MNATTLNVSILPVLADLLEYPTGDYHDLCRRSCATVRPWCSTESAEALDKFLSSIERYTVDELEELHTRTFSLSPVCVPYVGVQLFGENNFKRGELLGGLAREFGKYGISSESELPDHLGSVLRLAAVLPVEELNELLCWCLCIALDRMARQIEPSESPYKHLIASINQYVNCSLEEARIDV